MKPKTPLLASLATAFIVALTSLAHSQQTAITNPLGFVVVYIAAGTGSAKTGSHLESLVAGKPFTAKRSPSLSNTLFINF